MYSGTVHCTYYSVLRTITESFVTYNFVMCQTVPEQRAIFYRIKSLFGRAMGETPCGTLVARGQCREKNMGSTCDDTIWVRGLADKSIAPVAWSPRVERLRCVGVSSCLLNQAVRSNGWWRNRWFGNNSSSWWLIALWRPVWMQWRWTSSISSEPYLAIFDTLERFLVRLELCDNCFGTFCVDVYEMYLSDYIHVGVWLWK